MSQALAEFEKLLSKKPEGTKSTYAYEFSNFVKWAKDDPDQLLTLKPGELVAEIKGYLEDLQKEGKSFSTQNKALSALQFFFDANDPNNDIPINWKHLHRYLSHDNDGEKGQDRAYTEQELVAMFRVSDLRTKVAIGLMAEGGLRIGALPELRLKDLFFITANRKGKEPLKFYAVHAYAGSDYEYWTFTCPDLAPFIAEYIGSRKKNNHDNRHADQPLFLRHPTGRKTQEEDPRSLLERLGEEEDRRLEPAPKKKQIEVISKDALALDIVKVARAARIREVGQKTERKEVMLDHGFRKRFRSRLEIARLTEDQIERLIGHLKKRRREYSRLSPSEIWLSTQYYRAIRHLAIQSPTPIQAPSKPAAPQGA